MIAEEDQLQFHSESRRRHQKHVDRKEQPLATPLPRSADLSSASYSYIYIHTHMFFVYICSKSFISQVWESIS